MVAIKMKMNLSLLTAKAFLVFFTNKPINISNKIIYKKLIIDLATKLIPTERHTNVKVFLIKVFPFILDKWAPKYPPKKDPAIKNINIFIGTTPILLKKKAPVKFQKMPTVKNVKLIAWRKSIPKVLIKSIVTSNPVPEEIEPFNNPIKKIKIKNLVLWIELNSLMLDNKPKSDLKNE